MLTGHSRVCSQKLSAVPTVPALTQLIGTHHKPQRSPLTRGMVCSGCQNCHYSVPAPARPTQLLWLPHAPPSTNGVSRAAPLTFRATCLMQCVFWRWEYCIPWNALQHFSRSHTYDAKQYLRNNLISSSLPVFPAQPHCTCTHLLSVLLHGQCAHLFLVWYIRVCVCVLNVAPTSLCGFPAHLHLHDITGHADAHDDAAGYQRLHLASCLESLPHAAATPATGPLHIIRPREAAAPPAEATTPSIQNRARVRQSSKCSNTAGARIAPQRELPCTTLQPAPRCPPRPAPLPARASPPPRSPAR